MGVYEDMANDAGYPYDTEENSLMANMIARDWEEQWEEYTYYDWLLSKSTKRGLGSDHGRI